MVWMAFLFHFIRLALKPRPFWHAIIDVHAPLSIEDVAVRLERLGNLPAFKVKQCRKCHPHVSALTCYWGVTSCATDFAWQFMLGLPVLCIQKAKLVLAFDKTHVLFL